jgi:hypothetical protein
MEFFFKAVFCLVDFFNEFNKNIKFRTASNMSIFSFRGDATILISLLCSDWKEPWTFSEFSANKMRLQRPRQMKKDLFLVFFRD